MPYYIADNYSPEAIALAEGLISTGHTIISNINYWFIPEDNKYLFIEDNESNYDIAIYDYKYLYHSKMALGRVNKKKINILLDRNDWITPEWKNEKIISRFNLILADHLLTNFNYPQNVYPWAIGYTNRIKNYIDKSRHNYQPANYEIVYNFRVGHNLRKILIENLEKADLPYPIKLRVTDNLLQNNLDADSVDKKYWEQTAKRHNPEYYKLLNQSLMTLAFGGYCEIKPFFYQPYNFFEKIIRKPAYLTHRLLSEFQIDASFTNFIFQYDSFRMWEAFYSNTCPILLDMEYWKFKLPVMPVEGEHYLGIKKMNCKSFEQKLKTITTDDIMKIGQNGFEWVQKYYSPVAVAQRLEQLLKTV